jgi:predicted DNA-binding protein (MmcQ/YjbR family)
MRAVGLEQSRRQAMVEFRAMTPDPRVLTRVRKLCLALPEAHEKLSHGEPTFFVKKKAFAMFANANTHHGRGRHGVWIKAAPGRQERAIRTSPARFFVPPYCGSSGWVGVYLDRDTKWDELADILRDAHRLVAPAKLLGSLGDRVGGSATKTRKHESQ